jgi:energy-coupling factor transport system ATP-binding protein
LALVEISDLTYTYPGEPRPALSALDLAVHTGETVLVVGSSGCGKSTLLRAISGLVPHFTGGTMAGHVRVAGHDTRSSRPAELAHLVGSVFQDPESQVVTNTVASEVAFALENVGTAAETIDLRVHEALVAMGMGGLLSRPVRELSGGQLQRVVLAAALAPAPAVLVLDEPTSQLDPSGAEHLFSLLRRINEDAGVAVVLAEHRLDRCYHWADRVVVLEGGRIAIDGPPREVALWAAENDSPFSPAVPRMFAGVGLPSLPLTVKEGRAALDRAPDPVAAGRGDVRPPDAPAPRSAASPLLEVSGLWYAYPNGVEALRDCSLSVAPGELVAIMGENGAGKSTLIRHFNGLLSSPRGRVRLEGRDIAGRGVEELSAVCGLLGQNPDDHLFSDTVADELRFTLDHLEPGLTAEERESRVTTTLGALGIDSLAEHEPRLLSAGQRQRVALAALLVGGARLLVLDEPTRGMDPVAKAALGELLGTLAEQGRAVVVVTHDVEFAADHLERAVVLSEGSIVADGPLASTLGATLLLAPQASRVLRDVSPGVSTVATAKVLVEELLG